MLKMNDWTNQHKYGLYSCFPYKILYVTYIWDYQFIERAEGMMFITNSLNVVNCVQARVIYSGSSEWSEIIFSVEKVKERLNAEDNEVGEQTCEELLEALSINRSLLLTGYLFGFQFSITFLFLLFSSKIGKRGHFARNSSLNDALHQLGD
jgi:hypothetical protein